MGYKSVIMRTVKWCEIMKKCPFISVCGGCKYDFTSDDYHDKKLSLLAPLNISDNVFWTPYGRRRRADFAFSDGKFGFFERGTKNIVSISNCPNLVPEINAVLPNLARFPWNGTGSALVTLCDNGIDMAVNSDVPYFSREFKLAAEKSGLIRVSWNGTVVFQSANPQIRFGDVTCDYPIGAFLQPTTESETAMRNFVMKHSVGAKRVADLFCGIGNFTFALNADGFDIVGPFNRRDLFKRPLTVKMLNNYDLVVMDPPRAGALDQCRELAHSTVPRIIYVSCNPTTLKRDTNILIKSGYKVIDTMAFDQFVGSPHWELAVVFEK